MCGGGDMSEELLKEHIKAAFKLPLVGDYIFSKEELNLLYNKTKISLCELEKNRGNPLGTRYDDVVFVSIVNACKEWMPEENSFFSYLYKKFLGVDDDFPKIYNYIRSVIERVSNKYNLLFFRQYQKKYYLSLSAHAMSPVSSIFSFFELCWRAYCEDLNFTYIEKDPIFSELAVALRKKFSDENVEDTNVNLGSQVYYFKAWLKGLAIYRTNDLMVTLIEKTIRDMDSLYNSRCIQSNNSYTTSLIEKWWNEKEFDKSSLQRRYRERNRIISDYKNLKPTYKIVDGIPCIYIDSFKFSSSSNNIPYLVFYNNEKEFFSKELELRGSNLLTITEPFVYSLKGFGEHLPGFKIKIIQGNEILYNSNNSLNREFILFKNDHEITNTICSHGSYGLFVFDDEIINQWPKKVEREFKSFYKIYSYEGEILQSKKKTVFFESEDKPRDFWLYTKKQKDMIYRENGKDYDVSDGDIYICTTPEIDVTPYIIIIDNLKFRLDSFSREEKDDAIFYQVSDLMKNGDPCAITLWNLKSNKIEMTFDVVKYENPTVSFDQAIYYEDTNHGIVNFSSKQYEGSREFCIYDEEVLISIGNGDIVVKPPIIYWKIDNEEKKYGYYDNYIYYKNLTNSSVLETSIDGELFLSDGSIINKLGVRKYNLGEHIYSIADSNKADLDIIFKPELVVSIPVIISKVYFVEKFLRKPFYIEEHKKTFFWRPNHSYVGTAEPVFSIQFWDWKNDLCDYFDGTLSSFKRDLNLKDGFYTVKVFLKKRALLGERYVLVFSEEHVLIGNEKVFKYEDAILKFTKAYTNFSLAPKKFNPFYVESITFLGSRDGYDFYSGYVFVKDKDGNKKYLNEMKNDKGKMERINPIRLEMKDEDSCWIVYGLGDEIDDFWSSFSINRNGDISICDNDPFVLDKCFIMERKSSV